MDGKTILIFLLSQAAANGWWYCATIQDTIGETPAIIIPVLASLLLAAFLAIHIANEWDG